MEMAELIMVGKNLDPLLLSPDYLFKYGNIHVNETREARAPAPLSTLNILISPVCIPQRHFPNASQAPLKPSTLFGFFTCSNPSRLDRLSITKLLIFCLCPFSLLPELYWVFFYVTIF